MDWNGSLTSMEAGVCVELVQTCDEKHDAHVISLFGYDNSSTISNVRETVKHDMQKWTDLNHAKKSLGNARYGLQS